MTVLDYLDISAAQFPNKKAVADEFSSLSFEQLKNEVYCLANILLEKNIKDKCIAVYAERKIETICELLAVAASGHAYLALNPDIPDDKNRKILKNAAAHYILGSDKSLYTGEDVDCEYLEFHCGNVSVYNRPNVDICDDDTLCMVYTSGSTGDPKGIVKSHASMVNFIEAYEKEFHFSSDEIIGNQSPFSADASSKDLYVMLKSGATLEIIPSRYFSFPVQLIEYLNERKISFISWVPSALAIVARLKTFRDVMPKYLKRVYFVGEVFPARDLKGWRDALPDLDYVNLFGSSEMSGICCYYRIPYGTEAPDPLPIGTPLSNTKIYLGENGIITDNQQGEIMVESGALADEYYNDPDKTAHAFCFIEVNGEKHYVLRTGDFARYDEEGKLVYLSRDDGMIKYKGYRIELGEVESAVSSVESVIQAACLYDSPREKITAFISCTQPEIKIRELNALLQDKLPEYMMPKRLIVLEKMPLNPNGKIDRAGLKKML